MITRIGPVITRIGGCDQPTETQEADESLGHFVKRFWALTAGRLVITPAIQVIMGLRSW
jgi:hypothetical protein